MVGDHIGITPYEVYEILLQALPEVTRYHKVVNGKTMEFTKRLSSMNRDEVGEFIDASVLYCRQSEVLRDVVIPDPDPYYNL